MSKPLKLVRVQWEDASVADDSVWVAKEGLPPPEMIVFDQVGYLLELNDSHIVLTSCVGRTMLAARDRIPIGMVRKIVEFDQTSGKPVRIPKPRAKRKTA